MAPRHDAPTDITDEAGMTRALTDWVERSNRSFGDVLAPFVADAALVDTPHARRIRALAADRDAALAAGEHTLALACDRKLHAEIRLVENAKKGGSSERTSPRQQRRDGWLRKHMKAHPNHASNRIAEAYLEEERVSETRPAYSKRSVLDAIARLRAKL